MGCRNLQCEGVRGGVGVGVGVCVGCVQDIVCTWDYAATKQYVKLHNLYPKPHL